MLVAPEVLWAYPLAIIPFVIGSWVVCGLRDERRPPRSTVGLGDLVFATTLRTELYIGTAEARAIQRSVTGTYTGNTEVSYIHNTS